MKYQLYAEREIETRLLDETNDEFADILFENNVAIMEKDGVWPEGFDAVMVDTSIGQRYMLGDTGWEKI